jgi:hypothetical protein
MKTNDLRVICESVEVMIRLLTGLGVMNENLIIIPNTLSAAKWLADEIMLDSSRAKIEQLAQLRLNEARAFLLLLHVVYGEINADAALPASTPNGTPEMYHTAAYAVERETVAYANRQPFVMALTQ